MPPPEPDPDVRRDQRIEISCTAEEKAEWRQAAQAAGRPFAEWARFQLDSGLFLRMGPAEWRTVGFPDESAGEDAAAMLTWARTEAREISAMRARAAGLRRQAQATRDEAVRLWREAERAERAEPPPA